MANQEMTSEQALKTLESERLYEAVRHLENMSAEDIFPKKYAAGIEHVAIQNTYKYFEHNPNMPLKEVVAAILANLKPNLSSELLLNVTQTIIQKWEKLAKTAHQTENELEPV